MGAWCSRVRGAKEKEKFYLARAAENFEKALEAGQPSPDMRAMYAYIIGDIHRRLGNAGEAKEWYGKVAVMLKTFGGEAKIGELAEQQMKEPKDIFG
jgi:tetratricopeptide (TPR) repeat protein